MAPCKPRLDTMWGHQKAEVKGTTLTFSFILTYGGIEMQFIHLFCI